MPGRWRLVRLWNRDEEQEEIQVMEEKDGASAGARKRKVGRLDSSKHLVQYKFPWLVPKKDNCKVVRMLRPSVFPFQICSFSISDFYQFRFTTRILKFYR